MLQEGAATHVPLAVEHVVASTPALIVQTFGVGFTLQAVRKAPPLAVQLASNVPFPTLVTPAVKRVSVHTPLVLSGDVRLLWCDDMPMDVEVNGADVALFTSTAALWQRVQVMPH